MIYKLRFLVYRDAIFGNGKTEVQNIEKVILSLRFWVTGVDRNGTYNLLFTKVDSLIWQNQRLSSCKGQFVLLYSSGGVRLWKNIWCVAREQAREWITENPSPHLAKPLRTVPCYYHSRIKYKDNYTENFQENMYYTMNVIWTCVYIQTVWK